MDQEQDLSEQRPEAIRQQIDETRSDLTDKLEAVEQKVMDTVADARSGVVDTVEAVKGAVHDTVDSVKHALDVGRHVRRHPWGMLAGSLAAGYVLGGLVVQRHPVSRAWTRRSAEAFPPQPAAGRPLQDFYPARTIAPPAPPRLAAPRTRARSWLSELTETFAPEIQQLKGLVIGTLMALVRDRIKQSVAPRFAPELERVVDSVTTKLGGVRLSGPAPDLCTQER
jgi:ElaB/YqjD/DUF883 family membrane-anchored ribosome-binding protein